MNFVPTETGHWVSEDFSRLAELLQDYDYNLELRWIPPENRTTENEQKKPYMVFHKGSGYPIKYLRQGADPREVLEEIIMGDMSRGNVLARIEAKEAANQLFKMKEEIDEREQKMDEVAFLVGTKKNYIKHNGKKLDDQLRPIL